MLLISAIVSGLAVGSMYGLIALGFHITYVVSNTVNFAQGSSVMLGAVLGYTFAVRLGLPMPLAVALSLLLCALFGLVVERALVRPFVERGSNGWLMATVAGGIVLDNIVLFTFGKEPRAFPSFLAQKPIELFGAGVFPLQLIIPVVGIGIAIALQLAFHRTHYGKALLAVVQNKDAARLMGINVRLAIAFSFALSTALAGLAGMLIAPLFSVHSDMGTLVRHQGLRGRHPRRHHLGVGRGARRPALWADRSIGHGVCRVDLYANRGVHRGHSGARRDAQRHSRPRGGEQGLMSNRARANAAMPLALLGLTAAGVGLVFVSEGYTHFILALVALTAVVGVGLNVLLGLAGQVSLGHVGFYAIGAYTAAILTVKGVSFWLAFPAAGLVAGAIGALLALPALRVTGPYLAMVTIAFAFIVHHGTVEWKDLTGGQNGLMGLVPPAIGSRIFGEREMAADGDPARRTLARISFTGLPRARGARPWSRCARAKPRRARSGSIR